MMTHRFAWGQYFKNSISPKTKNYFLKKLKEQAISSSRVNDFLVGETDDSFFQRSPLQLSNDGIYRIIFNIPGQTRLPDCIHLEIHYSYSLLCYIDTNDGLISLKKQRVSEFEIGLLNLNNYCFINPTIPMENVNKNEMIKYVLLKDDLGYFLTPA